jgi:hypothetical protein
MTELLRWKDIAMEPVASSCEEMVVCSMVIILSAQECGHALTM